MGIIVADAKIRLKRSNLIGVEATSGPSLDHTDGTWNDTDIYVGELMLQNGQPGVTASVERLWVRTNEDIRNIPLVVNGGSASQVLTLASDNSTSVWQDLVAPIGGIINVDNGLNSPTASTIYLGGELIENTTLSSGTYSLTLATDTNITSQLKYTDGNEANNYILTSDASGNGNWTINNISNFINDSGYITSSGNTNIGNTNQTITNGVRTVDINTNKLSFINGEVDMISSASTIATLHVKKPTSGKESAAFGNVGAKSSGTTVVIAAPDGTGLPLILSNEGDPTLTTNQRFLFFGDGANGHRMIIKDGTSGADGIRISTDDTKPSYFNVGNLGVGLTAPTAKLHIKGVDNLSGNYALKVNSLSNELLTVRNDGVVDIINSELYFNSSLFMHKKGHTANIFIGEGSGTLANANTIDNIGIGINTLDGLTTSDNNVAIGSYAGSKTLSLGKNTYIGYQSGIQTTGGNNTFLGAESGYGNLSGSGNIFIGHQAGNTELGSDKLYIANQGGVPLIYGDFTTTSVALGTITPNVSAKLDIVSTTQGVLFPRMTTVQKTAIIAVAGLQVYDTTLNQMSYFNGTIWVNY